MVRQKPFGFGIGIAGYGVIKLKSISLKRCSRTDCALSEDCYNFAYIFRFFDLLTKAYFS
jgi:hypothetical protein